MGSQLTPVQAAWSLVEPARADFTALLAHQDAEAANATFLREAGFAAQVLSASEYALKIARANPQSVINAVTNVAAIGITLNPAKKQAYLVPRDNRICLDISYMGLIDLATETGSIRWAQADVVCVGEGFRRQGFDKAPIHEFDDFQRDFTQIRGAYTVVKTADGDFLTHTMSIEEIWDIRDRSSAWRAWLKDKKKCPWVTDFVEMAKKTCIKRAAKTWPRDKISERLAKAIQFLNTDGDEGLEQLAGNEHDDEPQQHVVMPQRRSQASAPAPASSVSRPTDATTVQPKAEAPAPAPANDPPATQGEKQHIRAKAGDKLQHLLEKCGIADFDGITKSQFAKLRSGLKELA